MEELAEHPVAALDAELEPLLVAPLLHRGADVHARVQTGAEDLLIGGDDLLDVHVEVPRQVGGAVPLAGLGLLVQLAQRRPAERVVPGEDGVGVVLDDVLDLGRVVHRDRQDRVDVVDLAATEDGLVVVEGGGHVGGQLLSEDSKAGRMNVREEAAGRVGIAEVDVHARREEVADDEAGQQLDETSGVGPWQVRLDERAEEHAWRCG